MLEGCFNALGDLTDAGLQPFVFGDQRIATEYSCHAAIALGKGHQHHSDLSRLLDTIGFAGNDLIHQGKNGGFNKLKQAFKHLRFAGKVSVEGCF